MLFLPNPAHPDQKLIHRINTFRADCRRLWTFNKDACANAIGISDLDNVREEMGRMGWRKKVACEIRICYYEIVTAKPVTQKDIARELGVSQSAVAAALGKIREESTLRVSQRLRQRICQTAERLGYSPNRMAQAMRTRKTQTVGLLFPNLRTEIHNLKLEALEQALDRRGYQAMIGMTHGEEDRMLAYVKMMTERWVDGILFMGGEPAEKTRSLLALLARRQTPCVMVDPLNWTGKLPRVCVDREEGMARLTRHLGEIGHRDFLFLSKPGDAASKIKGRGLARVVKDLNRMMPSARLRWAPSDAGGWRSFQEMEDAPPKSYDPLAAEKEAYHKAQEVACWSDRPTVVVAPSDALAMAFIQGLKNAGLRVPRDLAVTGFDDGNNARYCEVPLTTVAQPREELAAAAVGMLMTLVDGRPLESFEARVPCRLVVRQSCGRPAVVRPRGKRNAPVDAASNAHILSKTFEIASSPLPTLIR